MIVTSELVTQAIDGQEREQFVKELVHVRGPEPLAMVRKRLPLEKLGAGGYRGAVLLTHGFGQNRYAWHLSGRSMVNFLARAGYDVFNLDLRGHGRSRPLGSHGSSSVDDYVLEDFPAALDEVLALSDRPGAFVVGHSMGGMIAAAAASRFPDRLHGLIAIGSPYHFTRGSRSLATVARLVTSLAELGGVPVASARLPVKFVGQWMHWYRAAWDSRILPIPVRAWHPGAFEPALLREYLQRSFDTASLGTLVQLSRLALKGEFRSADGWVDYGAAFERCDVPLLVVAGTHDLLAPPPSVRPMYERSRATDRTYREFPLGHADLLLGRDAPRYTWPLVVSWLDARAPRGAPRGAGKAGARA